MIRKPDSFRRYSTAYDRLLKPGIVNFFKTEFSGYFGPIVRENIAVELLRLFNSLCPEKHRLEPGQMVWNALDKQTRADSPNRKYKTVILTIVDKNDIEMFEKQKPLPEIRKQVVARLYREAYRQGALLSTRDLSLILTMDNSYLSKIRAAYEQENQTVLPHPGTIQDMGSTLTHKKQIVFKHIVEKKDPRKVAFETNHSQKAVDRYIKDFYRVKTLVDEQKDIDFINLTTCISKHVIKQYKEIIELCCKT